jgi:DNA polymerase-3 subunit alpha
MDFLGLSTLTLIQDALTEIKRTEGIVLDIDNIPLDDAKTYQLFVDGQTYGIFQFESSGMREILRRAKPQRLEDLIADERALSSRPPQGRDGGRLHQSQGRPQRRQVRAGGARADPRGYLRRHRVSGTGHAHAPGAGRVHDGPGRRAAQGRWGRKTPRSWRSSARPSWRARAPRASIEKKAAKIFDLMEYFAGYGFNKSHSTAYAFLAYQTAYLKANYPWHFAAALLTIEAQNTDKLAMYLAESRDRGIPVLPPGHQRKPVALLGRAREGRTVWADRDQRPRRDRHQRDHRGAQQLGGASRRCTRCARSSTSAGQQARVRGAREVRRVRRWSAEPRSVFVPIHRVRARLFARIDAPASTARARSGTRNSARATDLFGRDEDAAGRDDSAPDVPPWSEIEQLNFEKETLGLYWSGHPSIALPTTCAPTAPRHARSERETRDGEIGPRTTSLTTAGPGRCRVRRSRRPRARLRPRGRLPKTFRSAVLSRVSAPSKRARGDRMCGLHARRCGGSIEVVVFPEAFKQYGHLAENGTMVCVAGRFERDDESARIIASEIVAIELVRERLTKSVSINVSMPPHDRTTFEKLLDVLCPAQRRAESCLRHLRTGTAHSRDG